MNAPAYMTSNLLRGKVTLNQPEKGFRASIDTVFAAAYAKINKGETLLDLGCGVGGIGLCVMSRVPDIRLTGLDILEDNVRLAQLNAAANNVADKVDFKIGHIKNFTKDHCNSFDHVIMNPPFFDEGTYLLSPSAHRSHAMGHMDNDTDLEDWIAGANRSLKAKGKLTLIHSAEYLHAIFAAMDGRFGAIEVFPLFSKNDFPAKRVLVRGQKGKKTAPVLRQGMIIHNEDGGYTEAAKKILEDGEAIKDGR